MTIEQAAKRAVKVLAEDTSSLPEWCKCYRVRVQAWNSDRRTYLIGLCPDGLTPLTADTEDRATLFTFAQAQVLEQYLIIRGSNLSIMYHV